MGPTLRCIATILSFIRILDRASKLVERLQKEAVEPEAAWLAINEIFYALCGEFPGAINVRHSYRTLKEFRHMDQEDRPLDQEMQDVSGTKLSISTPRVDSTADMSTAISQTADTGPKNITPLNLLSFGELTFMLHSTWMVLKIEPQTPAGLREFLN